MRTLSQGAHGEEVLDVQARLAALGYRIDPEEHGTFGRTTEGAVRAFQQRRHVMVDGSVDQTTWDELVEAGFALGDRVVYLRYPFHRGDDVRALQTRLNLLGFDAGREDGIFGSRTDRAVREFQRNVGLPDDGIVGPTTITSLGRLRPVGPGPGRATVREGEALRRLSATMQSATIAVDPGHGAENAGASGPHGRTEAEAAFLLAEAVGAELAGRGAHPFLLRGPDTNPSPSERAAMANSRGAEILVSLHLNSHTDHRAEGASTYYYGGDQWISQPGQRLAELILEQLTGQLGLRDCRTHPKSIPLLRETRMPAVQVEPCHITNPSEEQLLGRASFRAAVASAIADGIDAFFGRRAAMEAGSTESVVEIDGPNAPDASPRVTESAGGAR